MEMLRSTIKTKLDPFKNVVNLSNKRFFKPDFKLFSKNLTFYPCPKQYNKHTLNKYLICFYRNVKLKAHFGSSKQDQLKLKIPTRHQISYLTGIFPSTFYYRYWVIKTQSYIEFQNSIFHLFHFNNSYLIAVVEVLFIINYPLEKNFKKDIFSVFFTL